MQMSIVKSYILTLTQIKFKDTNKTEKDKRTKQINSNNFFFRY